MLHHPQRAQQRQQQQRTFAAAMRSTSNRCLNALLHAAVLPA
jgi:hypothetical protein